MFRSVTLSVLGLFLTNAGITQNEFDALRYSNTDFYGEARFNSMGGSFGALGANMSALSVNPGGLGVYKSSDFSFTTASHYNYTASSRDGFLNTDGKLNLHFGNVGLVGNFDVGGNWKAVNIGIGYNRVNNFNTSISVKTISDSSLLSNYVNELNADGGTFQDDIFSIFPYSANLAYQTYLVNPLENDSLRYDHVFSNSRNLTRLTTYETRGGHGETYFALGGNYADKWYMGALIGVPNVKYVYNRTHTETSETSDTLTDFNSFTVHDYVRTTGAGINFKLGLIYRATSFFRLGAAFHTPTVFSLTDQYETTMDAEQRDGVILSERTLPGIFNYTLTTPYRVIASASVVVGNHGVVNVDYEFVDYSTARLYADNIYSVPEDFSIENNSIANNFQATGNLRAGAEWRLDPFRVRAGYRYQGDPVDDDFDNSASVYSLGAGIKGEGYYLDLAYSIKAFENQTAVIAEQNDFVNTKLTDHYMTFTLGFRF